MKRTWILVRMLSLGLVVALALVANLSLAQEPGAEPAISPSALAGNSFTYQGYLTDGGNPANGKYDFSFALYADEAGTQWVANAAPISDHPVEGGLFTVQVDFTDGMYGDVYFYLNGEARWLRVGVRPGASAGAYTTLKPLQPLTPTPYALALPGMNTVQNSTSANVLGGYSWNYASSGIVGATISGGGRNGARNEVQADYAAVGGGASNVSSGAYATIPGGLGNEASGDYSLAAGRQAGAVHNGSFVWADATGTDFNSAMDNQFRVRAASGAEVLANNGLYGLRAENSGAGDGIRAICSSSQGSDWGALYAFNSGSSPGVVAKTGATGTYSGYFQKDIYVQGNCVGCTIAYVGRNDGPEPLEPGDLVAVSGLDGPLAGTTDPLLRVHQSRAGQTGSVIGVVREKAVLVESDRDGQRTQSAGRAYGARATSILPGEYLFIVVQGLAQVKADATQGSITPGQRLTVAEQPGHARALHTRIVEEMVIAEGADTLGVALGPLDAGTGLIPVMVTLH